LTKFLLPYEQFVEHLMYTTKKQYKSMPGAARKRWTEQHQAPKCCGTVAETRANHPIGQHYAAAPTATPRTLEQKTEAWLPIEGNVQDENPGCAAHAEREAGILGKRNQVEIIS
jgi:hypothetical protein